MLEAEGVMLKDVSGYAPQVRWQQEEKEKIWREIDEGVQGIYTAESGGYDDWDKL